MLWSKKNNIALLITVEEKYSVTENGNMGTFKIVGAKYLSNWAIVSNYMNW